MIGKTISNRVNRSLPGGHFVTRPLLFSAVSSRKRPAQAWWWLNIIKMSFWILLIWSNGCASEDKASKSLVKSRKAERRHFVTDIYEHEAIQKPNSENNMMIMCKNTMESYTYLQEGQNHVTEKSMSVYANTLEVITLLAFVCISLPLSVWRHVQITITWLHRRTALWNFLFLALDWNGCISLFSRQSIRCFLMLLWV